MTNNAIRYILKYPEALLQRHTLIDLFTSTDRIPAEYIEEQDIYYIEVGTEPFVGMMCEFQEGLYAVTSYKEISSTPDKTKYSVELDWLNIHSDIGSILLRPTDTFVLRKGDIANFKEPKNIETTVGRFVVNYVLLVDPFGDLIPYQNQTFKGASKLEKLISDNILARKINAEQERRYGANILFLTSNPEYFSPSLTKKVLTTGDNVKKRKKELLEKYKKEIEAGDVVTIAKIEEELVQLDKDYCKGDLSKIFLMKDSYFSNIRKKLFIIHGAVPSFGKKGVYDFIPNSLEEGWSEENFSEICNEIRDGIHSRSTEVAKGGDQSNFILRIFLNTRITVDDCHTPYGLKTRIMNYNSGEFIGRNIIENGKTISLTKQNIHTFVGKIVTLRSPMYCRAKEQGTCYKCTDKRFEETKQDTLATIMNTLGAMFSTLALKKVHNTAVSSTRLLDIDNYIL